MKLVVSTS